MEEIAANPNGYCGTLSESFVVYAFSQKHSVNSKQRQIYDIPRL